MASLSSPFTYEAAKVIFGSIYLHLHLQTVLNLQDLFELKKVDISTDTTLQYDEILRETWKQVILPFSKFVMG